MRIPKTFLPEKDLEKKIEELIKNPTKLRSEDLTEPEFCISIRAKEVVQRLGKKDLCGYTFTDEETTLTIEYNPSIQVSDIQIISIGYEEDKVFESAKRGEFEEKIFTYTPGEWERELERLYIRIQQK